MMAHAQSRSGARHRASGDGAELGSGAGAWRAEQLRAGDASAFDAFIRQHWAPLVYYIQQRVHILEHAQDLAQESFARLWERRAGIDPSRSVVSYLYQVARHLVIDELRKLDVRRRWEEEGRAGSPAPGPGHAADRSLQEIEDRATLDALARAVEALPARRREAFLLVHVQGLSYREAADVMGNAPQTVANQATAALAELRRILRPLFAGAG